MKPPPFDYVVPDSIDDAIAALAANEEARVLAGGQSLVPMMNLRLARPAVLVDCNRVRDLASFAVDGDTARIGAFTRHRRLELDVEIADAVPLLSEAASLVGYPQIRNRATIGGSLSHADPAAEISAACIALGATVNVRSTSGERSIPIAELFEGFFTTTLQPGELLVSIDIPTRTAGAGYAFREFAPRHGDFALAGIGVAVERNGDGTIDRVRMAGCGVGSTVVDLTSAAEGLAGSTMTDDGLRDVARRISDLVHPVDDVHASGAYRVELAQLLAVEALRAAWNRTTERRAA
jgi:CO/xanthine dehydrogenase FAD-binding subunit